MPSSSKRLHSRHRSSSCWITTGTIAVSPGSTLNPRERSSSRSDCAVRSRCRRRSGSFCMICNAIPTAATLPGETAIVPAVIQEDLDLCRLCKRLLEEGIYTNPVLRPAAAQNLLRISCTAAHTEKHVDRLVTTLVKVATELGIEL